MRAATAGSGLGHLSWRFRFYRKRAMRMVCSRLYRDENRAVDNSMMIAGTARSGTTWLADIVTSQAPCRVMFEPFNAYQVNAFSRHSYFQYLRPAQEDDDLYRYCQQIFTGAVRHPWIDREVDVLRPRYRLIKEIRANLFLKWISDRFPDVPLVFIIRHPCAVVLSRMRLDWWTDGDIEPMLAQGDLVDDFLRDKLDLIARADTLEKKHAVIWCINNLVPLRQFDSQDLNVVFYEHLVTRPETEIPGLFNLLGLPFEGSVRDIIVRPSMTTVATSAIVGGGDLVTSWRRALSAKQVSDVLQTVKDFGLGDLYGDADLPAIRHGR